MLKAVHLWILVGLDPLIIMSYEYFRIMTDAKTAIPLKGNRDGLICDADSLPPQTSPSRVICSIWRIFMHHGRCGTRGPSEQEPWIICKFRGPLERAPQLIFSQDKSTPLLLRWQWNQGSWTRITNGYHPLLLSVCKR